MTKKSDALDFHALDALVADFVCAYKSLHRESSKPTNGASHAEEEPTLREGVSEAQATTPHASYRHHVIPKPREGATSPHASYRTPREGATSPHASCRHNVLPKPLTPRFEKQEAEEAGQLEQELPRLLPEEGPDIAPDVMHEHSMFSRKSLYSEFGDGRALIEESVAVSGSARSQHFARSRTVDKLILQAASEQDQFHVSDAFTFPKREHFTAAWNWCMETPGEEVAQKTMEPVMALFILANCVLTGVSLDTEDWNGWYFIECFFAVLYTFELCVRLRLLGWREMYFGTTWCWSLFDTLIVFLAIVDLLVRISGAVTMFRVLRLLRLSRILRLIRLPILKELNMLVRGMVGGVRCLFWCIIFLALPIYIIGMIVSQILNDWEDGLFSSVPASMFTTLRCMCGDCTDAHGRPLLMLVAQSRGWAFALFYSIFILVTMFGVFNLITAIFIEGTMLAAKSDAVLQSQLRQADDRKFTRNIKRLVFKFWVADDDKKSGRISRHFRTSPQSKEFRDFNICDAMGLEIEQDFYQHLVHKPDIREVLDDMGLHDEDVVDLFDMLDVDRSGTLDLTELVTGLHKLRGDARKHDLVGLAYMIYSVQDSLRELSASVDRLCEAQGPPQGGLPAWHVETPFGASFFPVTPRESGAAYPVLE